MGQVTVGLVQMVCDADPQVNDAQAREMIAEAASQGAQIVCLPELFRSRYFCQTEDEAAFDLAEPVPGPTTEWLRALAQQLDIVIIASLFEKRAPGLYHNTAVVLDGRQGYLGKYRKMHIPDDPLYYEKFYFTPGDLGYQVFTTTYGRVGTLVCWDQWYPEAARLTAMQGADILFYPTAIGWHPAEKAERGAAQHDAWETIQRGHAIANGCFVVAVNRAGWEPTPNGQGEGIEFWGQSFVCAPDGRVLVRGPVDQAAVLTATLSLDQIETQRRGWPFWRDRRIESYQPLTQRFLLP
ncbi:MAG: carbon-nitrogen hydrolase [Gloeomargarita sp. SKYBB_i_bin120]|nr:carbon-nitrogen hydrolase [Gloeomargarita sp. SKYB120]MDW8179080.1 carbon-nitrogen hydrolase [Gloeomargarita sp. SKYBB_i_bin120]